MRLRRYLAILSVCVAIGVGGAAHAQAGAAPPTVGAGRGIRLGEPLVLHLGIAVDVTWDSNVFYEANNGTSAFFLRINPFFDLTNRPRAGTRMVQFDLHGGLGYVEYLTTSQRLAAHRQFNVDAGLAAAFFSTSPYNFSVFDNYVRTVQPPYTVSSSNFDRDTNEVGVRVNLSPGGGRLTFNVGYLFGIDYFERAPLTDYNVQYHRFDLRASWRFFPKTALYVALDETLYHYPTPGTGAHSDSRPFHVMAGIQGLVTTKLTVNLWVGYGNGFYVTGPSPNTAIGGVSLSWKPTLLSTGVIGYQHDFQNSLLGSYYDVDMAYISWTQLIWRFTAFARLQYSNMRFNGVNPLIQATTNGTDNNVVLNLRVDYPFKDWLIGSVGYDLYFNKSNRMLTVGMMGTPGTIPVDYTRNVVYVRMTLSY